MFQKIKQSDLLLMLCGALLTALILVVPSIGFLQWVSLIPLVIGSVRFAERTENRLKKAYFFGFITIYLFYFVIYHWLVNLYPLDFIGMNEWESLAVILAGWLGLPLLQAIPGGLILLFFTLFKRTELSKKFSILDVPVLAFLWVAFEWSSTFGWTGVPWGRLALGQIKNIYVLQSASLFGSYWITFLLVLVNGLLAYAVLHPQKCVLFLALSIVITISNLLYGFAKVEQSAKKNEETVKVSVIQGNIDSHEKWDSGSWKRIWSAYSGLTEEAALEGAEIVVWPETAMPYVMNKDTNLKRLVSKLASDNDVTVIVGALYDDEDGNEYNALYLVSPDGTIEDDLYFKRHLVPFGEYVPMRDVIMTLIPPLANVSALDDELAAGTDSNLFDTPYGKIGSMICFDSIYEELARDSVNDGAELLVISSNDSWFYDSAAVYQHEGQGILRAIETGKYVVRAANTGISAVITPQGANVAWIDPLETGYAVADVSFNGSQTLYDRIGNAFVYVCLAGILAPFIAEPFLRKKKNKS